MVFYSVQLLIAYIIDILIGDPKKIPHPVVMIGFFISKLERAIRRFIKSEQQLKSAGVLFPLLIVSGTFFVTAAIVKVCFMIHPLFGWVIEIWLISTTIAVKGLAEAGMNIFHLLKNQQMEEARKELAMIVGRDTANLDEREIARGAIETVAENIVDAIISPLFFALIGGAPLAMAYRATNTLDSMVGYKNEKYENLGWASARFDDILNFVPARITGVLLMLTSSILRLKTKQVYLAIKKFSKLHPSPNSGIPEAGVAGALGIQLGGTNYYGGIPSHRAKMGEPVKAIEAKDIKYAVTMMHGAAVLFIVWGLMLLLF